MPKKIIHTTDYLPFIHSIKKRIQTSQIKAAVSVNQELLRLYWFLGGCPRMKNLLRKIHFGHLFSAFSSNSRAILLKCTKNLPQNDFLSSRFSFSDSLLGEQITEKQKTANWGDGLIKQISHDLQQAFPDMKGFSVRNIKYIKQWYLYWSQDKDIGQQVVAQLNTPPIFQIPWGQNLIIISKSKSHKEALFYLHKTIANNWSRAVLIHQMELALYQRQGESTSNFANQLPTPQSDLAKQTLKDPYCFDFLTLTEQHQEKDLESALIKNISEFLLELGAGFSFLGKQYKLSIGERDFYVDLLFYHIKLRCYVVIELKTVEFTPEFAGKLNFYISAVDDLLATEQDQPTIGILICKSKNRTIVEYALKEMKQPIGVSEYELTQHLPNNLKSALPSIEKIEAEIARLNHE